jgi:hypothetical protein
MCGNNPKFLKELPPHSLSWVLSRLNMSTRRQPEQCISVINEKNIVPINDGKV